jgi:signal transduction histidine kinase
MLTRQRGSSPSVLDSPAIVATTLAAALRAPVRVLAGHDVVAEVGGFGAAGREVPVHYSGRRVGAIVVARRPSGPLASRENRMLLDVAEAVGPVLDAVQMTEDLRRASTRLVEARDAERARLRRDLHDGVGPTLAGITMGIDAARHLVAGAPEQAEASLARLGELAGGATAEVRRVVQGLRPEALDELDLADAIRRHTDLDGVSPPVLVRDQSMRPLPPDAEDVALRVALEAITNVRRHSGASTCEVEIGIEDGVLQLMVDDDGRGLPAAPSGDGVGLRSMRSRVEGVGGSFQLGRSPLGGVRVMALIPLGAIT